MPAIAAEPTVRVVVVRVRGIEQRHQDIHIEQRDAHAWSRKALTVRRSGFDAPAFGMNNSAPLRTFREPWSRAIARPIPR